MSNLTTTIDAVSLLTPINDDTLFVTILNGQWRKFTALTAKAYFTSGLSGGGGSIETDASIDGDGTLPTPLSIATGGVTTVKVADDAITFAKMQNIATAKLLGRSTAASGNIEEISIGANLSLSGGVLSATGGGGGGDQEYQATGVGGVVDEGCFITATIAGATFSRTGGAGQNTEGTLTIPNGGRVKSVTIHFSGAQAPGNTYYLNIDYNQTAKTVDGSLNTLRPMLGTVTSKPGSLSDVTGALNYVNSGTPLQISIVDINDNGSRVRKRIKITNYSQQVGANASIFTLMLP